MTHKHAVCIQCSYLGQTDSQVHGFRYLVTIYELPVSKYGPGFVDFVATLLIACNFISEHTTSAQIYLLIESVAFSDFKV